MPEIIDVIAQNRSQIPASRGSNPIEWIVVHYLGVPNADNHNLWGGGYGGHFYVSRSGEVYQTADPRTDVLWHCGGGLQGSSGHTYHGICTNYNSIGIENGVCADTSSRSLSGDSSLWYFTTETQNSLVWLVSKLMSEYNIDSSHVIRHYDVTGKTCPNPYVKNNKYKTSWTWEEFKSKLSANGSFTYTGTRNFYQPVNLVNAVKEVTTLAKSEGWKFGNPKGLPPCSNKVINEAGLISRALYNIGLTSQKSGGETLSSLPGWLKQNSFQEITSQDNLQQGDIVFFKRKSAKSMDAYGHAFVLASYDKYTTRCTKYQISSSLMINMTQPISSIKLNTWPLTHEFFIAYRLQMTLGTGRDPRDIYLEEAAKHLGSEGHKWVQSMTTIGNAAWCAATMCAIAKAVGYADVIMPGDCWGAGRFNYLIVTKYGGTRIEGGATCTPDKGDFIGLYPASQAAIHLPPEYHSHHIGVVESVEGDTVITIEGNHNDSYVRVRRSKASIGWYARPDWSKVGGLSLGLSYGQGSPLYTTSSTRADATIREIGYLSESGEPSISKTDIKLSVINYTSVLAEFAGLFGGGGNGVINSTFGTSDNIDSLSEIPRQIVTYLKNKGLNTAAAIGIIANIQQESSFRTDAVGDNGTSFGICQWHLDRGSRMKAACGGENSWKNNLTGQLDYLWSELNGGYKAVLDSLMSVSNDLAGAQNAAEVFVRRFEQPGDIENEVVKRRQYAQQFWSKVIVNSSASYSPQGSVSGRVDNAPITNREPISNIVIPDILDGDCPEQSGILADYTSYTRWFSSWSWSCRRVADVWDAKGRQSLHNVATIDGYYLIAIKSRFADTGDLVQIVLEDGTTLNCILGDEKGENAHEGKYSPWGHVHGGKVSIVEWEAIGTEDTWKCPNMEPALKEWGIYKKKVKQITNFGRYC